MVLARDFKQERKDIDERLHIEELAARYIPVVKKGKLYVAHCPFHEGDHTASLTFYPATNTFFCYGCSAGSSVFDFLAKIENLQGWPKVMERARELVGILPAMPVKRERLEVAKADWTDPAWQTFAKRVLKESRERLTGQVLSQFTKWRGITAESARSFGLGWSGDTKQMVAVSDGWLVIPPKVYLFARVDNYGRVRQIKWRNTDPRAIEQYGKYSQLRGSEPGLFNVDAAKKAIVSGQKAIVAKGEFEVMLLRQFGIEAVSSTASESDKLEGLELALGIDPQAGVDQTPIFYIADRDERGRAYAHERMETTPRMRACYTPKPYKDLGEWFIKENFQTADLEEMFGRAKRLTRKRKTYMVTAEEEGENAETVELEDAREILAKTFTTRYMHPALAKNTILQVAAQPGVGKGWAANDQATIAVKENHQNTTGWFAPRKDMYHDQPRDPEWWKKIEGRTAAKDVNGTPVDFDHEDALPNSGNCTVDGERFHRTMAAKSWELESHNYCKKNCPALTICQDKGYYAQLRNDGKNAFMTFAHLFTTVASNYKHLIIDEIRYSDFIRVDEVDLADLIQLRGMTFNFHMQSIQKALMAMLTRKDREEDMEGGFRLSGQEFYKELDETCVELCNGRGILQLIEQADQIGGWADYALVELLHDLSPENAEKLPKNIWHIKNEVPGAGGIYDIIRQEAPLALGMWREKFVSRIELLKLNKKKPSILKLNRRRYISAKVAKKPISVLDATGNPELLKELLSYWVNIQEDKELRDSNPIWVKRTPKIERVAPQVAMPEEVKIVHDTRLNFSKYSLSQSLKGDKRYFNAYLSAILDYLKPDRVKTLIICSSKIKTELGKALVARGCTPENGYLFALEHYGNLRGSNQYKDWPRLIEAGLYNPNFDEIISHGRALFGGAGEGELDTALVRRSRLYDYRTEEGRALADDVLEFADTRLQMLMEQLREDELYQDAYRIRPLSATSAKEIVLLFGLPLAGLKPSIIVSRNENDGSIDKLSARSRRAFDKLVEAGAKLLGAETDHLPVFTQKMLAQAAGCSESTVLKYIDRVAKELNAQLTILNCNSTLPGRGGTKRNGGKRTLTIVTPLGDSPTIYNILYMVGELPIFMPEGWTLADIDPDDFKPDNLFQPEIKTPSEAPRKVRSLVTLKFSVIDDLEKLMIEAFLTGKFKKAYILRERRHLTVLELNTLIQKRKNKNSRS